MSTRADHDEVEIQVGGQAYRGWTRYEIDSSLLVPADAWRVALQSADLPPAASLQPGARARVRIRGEVVLDGAIDDVVHGVAKDRHDLLISGRDGAGILLDCSAPILTAADLTLEQVVARVVRPLGVTKVRIDATSPLTRARISTEPGDTAWDMLSRAAEANGLWPWFEPGGTLVVGGPDYQSAPVGRLELPFTGNGLPIVRMEQRRSIQGRYSEITVMGQRESALDPDASSPNLRATVRDEGVSTYRPRIVVDHEATSTDIAKARGSKLVSDAALNAWEARVEVVGHRAPNGALWTPGMRVNLTSIPHDLDGVFFVIARTFLCDRGRGQRTDLVLKQDGVWALYAHPSSRRHRRGKNAMPAKVVDATTGAPPRGAQ